MSTGLYSITTRATGTVLTASIYNADHQNHVTNQTPQMIGAYSDNAVQMRTTFNPGTVGAENLPGSLADELGAIRSVLKTVHGDAQWYPGHLISVSNNLTPVTKSANYSVLSTDSANLLVGTASLTFTLPAANSVAAGATFSFKADTEQGITLARTGADTFDGGDTSYLMPSYATTDLISDGTSRWYFRNRPQSDVGNIRPHGGSSAPRGYLLAFGQAVSRTTYGGLFSIYSTTYGAGDGSTTFNLPDLRGRGVAGKDDMGGTAANRLTAGGSGITGTTLGAAGGAETVTLSVANIPAHTHSTQGYSDSGGSAVFAQGASTVGSIISVGSTGGGGAHQNTQPTLVLNLVVKT